LSGDATGEILTENQPRLGVELRRLLLHCYHLAGARIVPDAGAAPPHREGAKPTQLDALAASQSGGDLVEDRRDDQLGVLLSQMRTAGRNSISLKDIT
jgi:hypothetical protein